MNVLSVMYMYYTIAITLLGPWVWQGYGGVPPLQEDNPAPVLSLAKLAEQQPGHSRQ